MSVQAISFVLNWADATGADRLVLLAIANHASPTDSGVFEGWPGIELIAEEAGLDAMRTVRNSITKLHKTGQIERITNGAPDQRLQGNLRPNLYRILTRPRSLSEQLGVRVGKQTIARFKDSDVNRHPALAPAGPDTVTLPGDAPIARRRRLPSGSASPAQVWVVDGQLYLRVGDDTRPSPDDELIPLEPTRGLSSDDREACRLTTARPVVRRPRGLSRHDRQTKRRTN